MTMAWRVKKMTTRTTTSSIHDYFHAVSTLDRAAYLACFSQEATVRDPYGGRPFQGHEGLNKLFNGLERTWESLTMAPGELFAADDRVATQWRASGTAKSGKAAEFAGINVFTLDDAGLIAQLDAYWDIQAMLAQIGWGIGD